MDGYTIFRENEWDTDCIIQFKEPIAIVFAYVGKEPVMKTVSKIKVVFDYEWFWKTSGRQNKIANVIEVYFTINEYIE